MILALGDCNTAGDVFFKNNSYPERFANLTQKTCKNCGYTMSTTREMLHFYNEFFSADIEIIFIQYGLVDSWKTFKYAPYVLYYPDNFFRKISRKIAKKYKKITRYLKLDKLFGTNFVVPKEEYKKNIQSIIDNSQEQKIFLIDTVPNKDIKRNQYIKQYNEVLSTLAKANKNCFKVNLYDEFEKNFDKYYLDNTHINDEGYEYVVKKLYEIYKS